MPSRDPLLHLEDILENVEKVREFTKGMSEEEFLGDDKTMYAVIRALEIISEATRHVSADLKAGNPHIPWQDVADAGNVYRHGYPAVDGERVWVTATVELEALHEAVRSELERRREDWGMALEQSKGRSAGPDDGRGAPGR